MQRKENWAQNLAISEKNPQFLSNQCDIHYMSYLVIFTKFHEDWQEIVDFLVMAKF